MKLYWLYHLHSVLLVFAHIALRPKVAEVPSAQSPLVHPRFEIERSAQTQPQSPIAKLQTITKNVKISSRMHGLKEGDAILTRGSCLLTAS